MGLTSLVDRLAGSRTACVAALADAIAFHVGDLRQDGHDQFPDAFADWTQSSNFKGNALVE